MAARRISVHSALSSATLAVSLMVIPDHLLVSSVHRLHCRSRLLYCPKYNLVSLPFQHCCASLQRDRSNSSVDFTFPRSSLTFTFLESREVNGYMTVGVATYDFTIGGQFKPTTVSVSHSFRDIQPQRLPGHDLHRLGVTWRHSLSIGLVTVLFGASR